MDDKVKILIADSQYLVTESLKFIFNSESRFRLLDIVSEKEHINDSIAEHKPSVLIIDPVMTDISSYQEIRQIKDKYPYINIVVLTTNLTKSELHELNGNGINCIVLKTCSRDEIIESVNSALRKKKFYSDELLEMLFDKTGKKELQEEAGQLTLTEIEIVRLISDGLTTREIAGRKFISYHTVITHRKNIFRKLGVNSVSELIIHAVKTGWIDVIEYNI